MPSSFLLNFRRKGRSQTSSTQESATAVEVPLPPRSSNTSPVSSRIVSKRRPCPSDTPSESSGRFLRFFKGSYAETDASSLASVDEPARVETPPPFHFPPSSPSSSNKSSLSSPHSLYRPLPPLPPVRPPRPPSLNLDVPLTPTHPKGIRRPPQRPLIPEQFSPRPGRKMPELDNVWEGFIRDVEGEDMDDFTIPPRRHGLSKDRPCVSNTPSANAATHDAETPCSVTHPQYSAAPPFAVLQFQRFHSGSDTYNFSFRRTFDVFREKRDTEKALDPLFFPVLPGSHTSSDTSYSYIRSGIFPWSLERICFSTSLTIGEIGSTPSNTLNIDSVECTSQYLK
ncbi:hypothetical protein B0H19DRAFT_1381945 [Mycena capillaripes]|nr:hypothetical protein B0H19DRAFT_1381945 [Mycena capillaripes]